MVTLDNSHIDVCFIDDVGGAGAGHGDTHGQSHNGGGRPGTARGNSHDPGPEALGAPNSNLGIFPYPSHSPFGMNGRFVYSRITYRF